MIGTKAITRKPQQSDKRRKATIVLLWAEHFDAQAAVVYTTQLRNAGICVHITGIHQQKVRGKYGIALYTDMTIHDATSIAPQIDCIIVPADASGLQTIAYEPRLVALFSQVGQNNGTLMVQGLAESEIRTVSLPLEKLDLCLIEPNGDGLEVYMEKWIGTLADVRP